MKEIKNFPEKTTFKHPKASPEAQRLFQAQLADLKKANQPLVYVKAVLLIRCPVDTVIRFWARGVLVNQIGERKVVLT